MYGTSDEAVNLMKSGEYDVIAASATRRCALIAAEDVVPVNTDLLENYDGIYDFLKNQSWNSVDGQSYGVPHGYGANLLMYNTEQVSPAPTSWSVVFDDAGQYAGKVTAYDSPIYIADAAVYLMTHNPELGIENPYALDADQLAASVDLLKAQRAAHRRVLVGLPQGDPGLRVRRHRRRHLVAGDPELDDARPHGGRASG